MTLVLKLNSYNRALGDLRQLKQQILETRLRISQRPFVFRRLQSYLRFFVSNIKDHRQRKRQVRTGKIYYCIQYLEGIDVRKWLQLVTLKHL